MHTSITLLNRLKNTDSATRLDVWYKYKLDNCEYQKQSVESMNGQLVAMGEKFVVLIPFCDEYKPYSLWSKLEDKSLLHSISVGDLIIFGDIEETEVTPNTIATIKKKYAGNVCEIKSITEVEKKNGARYQFKLGGV